MVNQITKDAGLVFNVNSVKGNMKTFYANQDIEKPQFKGGQIAITACLQKFCDYMVRNVHKATAVDKSGVRRVTRSTLRYCVLSHEGMNEYFMNRFRHFRKNMMYMDQLPVTNKEVKDVCTAVDKDMVITPKAMNLLAFCLVEAYQDMVATSHQFLTHSRKKQLDGNTVMFAIRNRFHDSIAHELCVEVERAMKACNLEVKAVEDDEDEAPEQDAGAEESADEDEEESKPKAKSAKPAKEAKETKETKETKESKPKKSAKKISESDDDDDDDDDEDEPVEAKPKPKGKPAKETKESKEVESKPAPAPAKGKTRRAVNN